jgi:hypothetical protein
MTEQQATPFRGLRLLPGGSVTPATGVTDTGTAPDTEGGAGVGPGVTPGAVPVSAAAVVVRMTPAERAAIAVRRRAGAAAGVTTEALQPFARLLSALLTPKTMAEHRAHVKSRAWVPPGMTGKTAAFVTAAGVAYHLFVARPVKAACKSVDSTADYPLVFFGYLAFLAILILILSVCL